MDCLEETKQSGRFVSEDAKVIAILRDGVSELPDAERQVIALHCGGELEMAEIASVLDIPRNAVSLRIRSAHDQLDKKLAAEGRDTKVSKKLIAKAICSGSQVPGGMFDRIMNRIERFELEAILTALYEDEDKTKELKA